jgi:3-hydroxypropanoate dehydrogenase
VTFYELDVEDAAAYVEHSRRGTKPIVSDPVNQTPRESISVDESTPAGLSADEVVRRKAARRVGENALRAFFLEARTANGFLDRKVPHELIEEAVELALTGPTSANGLPLRLVFVESPEAKERLRPAMSQGNVDKTMAAPLTAIVATDLRFYEFFPQTFPERGEAFKGMFEAMDPAARRGHAWDNAVLQMGYFVLALRAVGLDAGPMAGFDRALVDAAFFPDGRFAAQYLINIGYGDDTKLFPRLPRFSAREIARFV